MGYLSSGYLSVENGGASVGPFRAGIPNGTSLSCGRRIAAALSALAFFACIPGGLHGQEAQRTTASLPINRVFKVKPLGELLPPDRPAKADRSAEHPLVPALKIATERMAYIQNQVSDYTCTLVKRERIEDTLLPYEYIQVKCRNGRKLGDTDTVPFSVYMKFLGPSDVKDREILYVDGANDGDMLVRKGGRRRAYLEVWLDPQGDQASRENRYPITEFGIENLVRRLIEVANDDMQYGDCHVRIVENASLDGRSCTAIQVTHPEPQDHFRFHVARIMIDNELQLPVHYSAYSWPETSGGEPVLLEEYTYRRVKVNVGLTDQDFQRNNPEYGFRKS